MPIPFLLVGLVLVVEEWHGAYAQVVLSRPDASVLKIVILNFVIHEVLAVVSDDAVARASFDQVA